ncbi:fungal hydrophobin [Hymenopellis radicata]|nr:fungal hydrophobin [Hymenopellis radicata]
MFPRLSTTIVFVLALVLLAAAVPTADTYGDGGKVCKTGSNQCCNTVDTVENLGSAGALSGLNGLLQIILSLLPGATNIGLKCLPIVGGSCTQQNVCCENNSFNGLVAIGCNNIGL